MYSLCFSPCTRQSVRSETTAVHLQSSIPIDDIPIWFAYSKRSEYNKKHELFEHRTLPFFPILAGTLRRQKCAGLLISPENVSALVELVADEIAGFLDFRHLTALNRSFLSETLREREADLVFRVPFRDTSRGEEILIHILIEHQSRIDKQMGFRFLEYMYNLWMAEQQRWTEEAVPSPERQRRPILPILFYTGDTPWDLPMSPISVIDVPEALTPFVPTFEVLLLDVKGTPPAQLTQTGQPLGWLLTVLQKEIASVEEITHALETALQHLETLQDSHTQQYHRAILYLASLVYHRRSPAERQTLIQVVDAYAPIMEVETMLQSMAEITYQQGIEQGARRTSIESTLAILKRRFREAEVDTLTPALEAIEDINRLKQLNLEASVIDTFHAFQERVNA